MNLYRKHRPTKFDEMIGNKETLEGLEKLFSKSDHPHVFLFTGAAGCGKTTAARIVANEILKADKLSITEINSANNRGIETARQTILDMNVAPFYGDYRVWIIDEVHKTTNDWQNAMLKPLEDTPDWVYFFLCTTNEEKLLSALKTRCSHFKFESLKARYISRLIKKVARAEEIDLDPDVEEEIAECSGGSPRKALVLLEKAVGLDPDKAIRLISSGVTDEEDEAAYGLCKALIDKNTTWASVVAVLKKLEEDPEKVRYAVMGYMNSVLLKGKQNERAAAALEFFSEPFYNSGKPGLTLACYQTLFSE